MPVVVPVKFSFAAHELWFDPRDLDIVEGDYAICSTERGTEIGLVTADPFEVEEEELAAPLKPVVRIATEVDLDRADDLADAGEDAMFDFRRLVEKNGLEMKPVGVEYLFGGEKAVFYFAAEDRVDFRQLVKDLSAFFHVRVDMRQIGVRDETRLQGGYATCGQELCCTRFGGQFEPVSIRMAKEQDLPLNSAKISGVCGRLMCCLRYEFEAYKDFKSRAPKKKTLIDTPLGKARIMEFDTPREQLILRLESGKVFRVSLADMTCTDENKERCEQQKCACRPDCVTRDVLESLESPELALALMELDRKNGVDVGDGLSSFDRIMPSESAPRRRVDDEERTSDEDVSASGSGRSRRGRKGSGKDQGQGKQSRLQSNTRTQRNERTADTDEAPSSSRRRRRRAAAPEQEEARPTSTAVDRSVDSEQGTRRRRRHTTANAASKSEEANELSRRTRSHRSDTRSVAEQLADGEVQVQRRRPGDGGGAPRRRPGDGGGARANVASEPKPAADDAAPKKRRRRRNRKPKQDGGSDAAPSAE
ncbi:PSP1 domain-containing protein [Collinsella provencensis]|uniref:PSP1 domain-containing protein n=1 Tax=Collinsella provencensis TaxID=1937461 RepID=UPI000C83A0D1|nr:regulatory iron-sulfur-containing complex subunit RicT [Collinsella provencensis]